MCGRDEHSGKTILPHAQVSLNPIFCGPFGLGRSLSKTHTVAGEKIAWKGLELMYHHPQGASHIQGHVDVNISEADSRKKLR